MAHAAWSVFRGIGMFNFEGLTLGRGELSTAGFGEGYVDRRHPHAYVHELLAGADGSKFGVARRRSSVAASHPSAATIRWCVHSRSIR